MKKAYHDFGILAEGDIFYGISLGYDFTAEHEWGIKGISRMFGIPELTRKNIGIKSRTITAENIEKVLVFGVDHDFTFLFSDLYQIPKNKRYSLETKKGKENIISEIPYDLMNYKNLKENKNKRYSLEAKSENINNNIITAWSSNDFGIVVKGKRESKWLHDLYQAFINKNIVFTYINLSGFNPFANPSLSILIANKLPQHILDAMKNVDKEHLDLKKIEKKLNLEKKLKETKKFREYSLNACSPKFIDYNASKKELKELKEKENTKYDIKFWINSSEYYGWNTVEEIKELINNKDLTVVEFKKQMNAK